ncbi:MAG: DUF805 domain-containing protein [Halothiobacillaceae bacterium]
MEHYLNVLRKYAVFSGRSGRREYWMFFLINVLITLAILATESALGMPMLLGSLYSLFILLPGLAVTVRRLHDSDRPGWWILVALIPLIGPLVLLFFMVQPTQGAPNRFGAPPAA